jgi:hypothetical protein
MRAQEMDVKNDKPEASIYIRNKWQKGIKELHKLNLHATKATDTAGAAPFSIEGKSKKLEKGKALEEIN